jgi:hypothetical protein
VNDYCDKFDVKILNYIPTFNTSLINQKIAVGTSFLYNLPTIYDFEGSPSISIILDCFPPTFISLTINKQLSIAPPITEIEANYTINFNISDGVMVNQYSMVVWIFIPPPSPPPTPPLSPPPSSPPTPSPIPPIPVPPVASTPTQV